MEQFQSKKNKALKELEELEKVKDRACERQCMCVEEIRMRLMERADMVSDCEEKEIALENMKQSELAKIKGFRELDSVFSKYIETRREFYENKRKITLNNSLASSVSLRRIDSFLGSQLSADDVDVERLNKFYDNEIENRLSRMNLESNDQYHMLGEYLDLQSALKKSDLKLSRNILMVENQLRFQSKSFDQAIVGASKILSDAKLSMLDLVDEEENLIQTYDEIIRNQPDAKPLLKKQYRKEYEELSGKKRELASCKHVVRILEEKQTEAHELEKKAIETRKLASQWEEQLQVKERLKELHSELERLQIKKLDLDNMIIKLNFMKSDERIAAVSRETSRSRLSRNSRANSLSQKLLGFKNRMSGCNLLSNKKLQLFPDKRDKSSENSIFSNLNNPFGKPISNGNSTSFESNLLRLFKQKQHNKEGMVTPMVNEKKLRKFESIGGLKSNNTYEQQDDSNTRFHNIDWGMMASRKNKKNVSDVRSNSRKWNELHNLSVAPTPQNDSRSEPQTVRTVKYMAKHNRADSKASSKLNEFTTPNDSEPSFNIRPKLKEQLKFIHQVPSSQNISKAASQVHMWLKKNQNPPDLTPHQQSKNESRNPFEKYSEVKIDWIIKGMVRIEGHSRIKGNYNPFDGKNIKPILYGYRDCLLKHQNKKTIILVTSKCPNS